MCRVTGETKGTKHLAKAGKRRDSVGAKEF